MSGIKDQERIDALRERLYERGKTLEHSHKHALTDHKEEVRTQWTAPPKPIESKPVITPEPISEPVVELEKNTMAPKKRKMGYRLKLVLLGIGFFMLAVVVSISIQLFGNNVISGENITLSVTGPFTIGAGDVLPLQVGITNSNAVDIESATLIVEYPKGTLSASEDQKELFNERLALDIVAAGETVNIPLRAIVFGEENDERNINVSIEYRVQGSNATFFKEADSLRFKINSSPIIVKVENVKKLSSGQETDITLTITSNSPTTLSELLVKAEYPIGFDFTSSTPEPSNAQNAWIIKDIEPEASKTIVIKGVVIGNDTAEHAINFTVGVPSERDQQSLASVFATAQTVFEVEQAFLGVALRVSGESTSEIVIAPSVNSSGQIEITNTLDDTIYDLTVEMFLGGNALSDLDVGPPNGFYDSLNNKIIWDVSNSPSLAELRPGRSTRLSFGVKPSTAITQTPQITLDVNVQARRISESQVSETLQGTAKSVLKIATIPTLRADAGFSSGIFTDSGSVHLKQKKKQPIPFHLWQKMEQMIWLRQS